MERLITLRPRLSVAFWSSIKRALLDLRWSVKSSSIMYMLPSRSHYAYIYASITLSVNSVTSPSLNCTKCVLLSIMGLLLARPHTWPPASRLCPVTRPFNRVLPRCSINYVVTYVSPTSGVGASSSGGSSAILSWMSSLSAYCSYTSVS